MTRVINLRKFTKNRNKIDIKNKNTIIYEERNKVLISVISIISILLGCLLFKYNQNLCISYIENYVDSLQRLSFVNLFIYILKSELAYFLLVFFIGTSIVGKPLVVISPILKCIFIGYLSSYIYSEYRLKGIMLCLIILFPLFAVSTSTLIFACNESMYMSTYISRVITKKNTADDNAIRLYLIRFLILFIMDIICILINSFITRMIIQRFNLL